MCKSEFTCIATRAGQHAVTPRKQRCQDSSGEAASLWINDIQCSECGGAHDEQLLIICDGGCGAAQHSYCVGLGRVVPEGDYFCRACSESRGIHVAEAGTCVAHEGETLQHVAHRVGLDVHGLL